MSKLRATSGPVMENRAMRIVRTPLIVLSMVALVLGAAPAIAEAPHAAPPAYQDHAAIRILSDAELDREHGVRSGNGTARRPYVISGWHVPSLLIADTSKHVVIRDNRIDGLLVLDWNGPHVHVHGNQAGDLRVNRNIARTGSATGGTIAHNRFGIVGQLRHFDGVFQHNVVGSPAPEGLGRRYDYQAVQFDGFNGARFVDNMVYGRVEARLHGHHHGSGFGQPSHQHVAHHGGMGHVDHSRRFHEVWIAGNTIHSDSAHALRYFDIGHADNDRTNNSETDRALIGPHIHFTRIHLVGNRLIGSGLAVQVFNHPDEYHTGSTRGLIEVRGNRITLHDPEFDAAAARHGINIHSVRDADVRVVGNVIEAPPAGKLKPFTVLASLGRAAGLRIVGMDEGRVWLYGNRVVNRYYGIFAADLHENVRWWIRGLVTEGVREDVHAEGNVRNPPVREP